MSFENENYRSVRRHTYDESISKTILYSNHRNYDKHMYIYHCISPNNFKDTSNNEKDTTASKQIQNFTDKA